MFIESREKSTVYNIIFIITYPEISIILLSLFHYYLLFVFITIITGPSELRTERSDFVRKRRDCVRIGLPDSVGRCSAYHDFISAVYDRPLHGTPRIPEPRV